MAGSRLEARHSVVCVSSDAPKTPTSEKPAASPVAKSNLLSQLLTLFVLALVAAPILLLFKGNDAAAGGVSQTPEPPRSLTAAASDAPAVPETGAAADMAGEASVIDAISMEPAALEATGAAGATKIALCALMKAEDPATLLEWVRYHR